MKIIFDNEDQKNKFFGFAGTCPGSAGLPEIRCSLDDFDPNECEKCWKQAGVEWEIKQTDADVKPDDRKLIYIPADGNYVEILGYKIDGFDSFESFLEYLKRYDQLEKHISVLGRKRQIRLTEIMSYFMCKRKAVPKVLLDEYNEISDILEGLNKEVKDE